MAKRGRKSKKAAARKRVSPRAGAKRSPKRKNKPSAPRVAKRKVRVAKTSARRATKIPPTSKAALRAKLRVARGALSSDGQRLASERLAANLASTRYFLASRRIACYLPNDGEIDPTPIIERLWRMHKQVLLPVLPRVRRDRLWFAPIAPGMQLVANRLGIPEPKVSARDLVRAEEVDLVLLPLVAFDARGNRLGRGAGFYDRSLAFRRHRRHFRKPRLLGLAHDFQRVPAVPTDAWDIPLDGVVTDRAVYDISP